jgi:ATP-dependent Zn protease
MVIVAGGIQLFSVFDSALFYQGRIDRLLLIEFFQVHHYSLSKEEMR